MNVPSVLPDHCRPLDWSDLTWLSTSWRVCVEKDNLAHSNYSAINALLFRESHHYCVFEHDPPFLIEPLPDRLRMIPTQFLLEWDSAFFEARFSKPCTLYPIPEPWALHFPETKYSITYSDAESDYLFRKETLHDLKGRHLSSRRNLLHQLTREHKLNLKLLTMHNVQEAKKVLNLWHTQHEQSHPALHTDYRSCHEALDKLPELPLTGQIVYAEETPIGFYLGERLNKRVYLLHFLKALSTFHGVVPFLYQACARNQAESVQWINLEPDLGIPSLRQAKKAYQPDLLLPKWEIKKTLTPLYEV